MVKLERTFGTRADVDGVEVVGGRPLSGIVPIEGSKISAVALIAASILTDQPVRLENVPDILDVEILCRCLAHMGADVDWQPPVLRIHCARLDADVDLPHDWMDAIHGVRYLLPALLIRNGRVRLHRSHGGCQIGERPVSHIAQVLDAFGARIRLGATIEAELPAGGLQGTDIALDRYFGTTNNKFVSGATKSAILAAVSAQGETRVTGAFTGGPVRDLCLFLRSMGADIEGEGGTTLRIRPGRSLRGGTYRLPFDPLVLGTYVAATGATRGAITCGNATIRDDNPDVRAFREMGIELENDDGHRVHVSCKGRLRPSFLSTETINTDIGPMFAVLLSLADGQGALEEVIWEQRFRYADGLRQMGGWNRVDGRTLHIRGVPSLRAADVEATDLRSAAALILAAMSAPGRSRIQAVHHLRRGYEDLPGRLAGLGAEIRPL